MWKEYHTFILLVNVIFFSCYLLFSSLSDRDRGLPFQSAAGLILGNAGLKEILLFF